MGQHNSSVTRAWPIFGALFESDSTGRKWLSELVQRCQGSLVSNSKVRISGQLDPSLALFERTVPSELKKVLKRTYDGARLRNCFEKLLPPPKAFLQWLLTNPDRMEWPRGKQPDGTSGPQKFREKVQLSRESLFRGSADLVDIISLLNTRGADASAKEWWAFEGFTHSDVYLETDSAILIVECKRKEALSRSTAWYPDRNQLARNLEIARELGQKSGKDYGVLICSQKLEKVSEEMFVKGLPHLESREELYPHYLGNALWDDVHDLCRNVVLPDTVDDAIASGVLNTAIRV